jgi:hypothetical protein
VNCEVKIQAARISRYIDRTDPLVDDDEGSITSRRRSQVLVNYLATDGITLQVLFYLLSRTALPVSSIPICMGKLRSKAAQTEEHMQGKNTKTINQLSDCPHPGPIFRDPVSGATFKGDCGDRRNCIPARNRFRREFESRLTRLHLIPRRPLVLWTFTARTAEQDARYRSVENGIDRGNPLDRTNWRILANGINQVESALTRQLERCF